LQSSKACTGTEAFRRQRFSDLLLADVVPSWAGLPKDGIFTRASLLDERLEFSFPKQATPLLAIRHRLFRSRINSGLSIAAAPSDPVWPKHLRLRLSLAVGSISYLSADPDEERS
jgi:hypothetical protein